MEVDRRTTLGLIGSLVVAGFAQPAMAQDIVALPTPKGRTVSVSRWAAKRRRGTILFSHGALSSPLKYRALIEPWVAQGWDVWAPLHVDSTDHPDTKSFAGLASWPARIEDMRTLAAHVGTRRYVAAGHSYGALVALTLGGATPTPPKGIDGPLRDLRAVCAVAFSPPGPNMGLIGAEGYATLAVPAFIQTGTKDVPLGMTDPLGWRDHLIAYEAPAPGGSRYAMVLDGADHYFGGLICRPELPGPKQTEQLSRAVAASSLFLAGYGAGNRRAVAALNRQTDGTVLRHR